VTRTCSITHKAFFAGLVLLSLVAPANAGPLYVFAVMNPTVTAGNGVAAVNGMTVTSTRSGPGTFHLYAVDDVIGRFGIDRYRVTLSGATAIDHRSPRGLYTNVQNSAQQVGYSDPRSITNTNPVAAEQTFNATKISTGRETGNFPDVVLDEKNAVSQISSGQWGTYGDGVYSADGITTGVASQAIAQPAWGGSGQFRSAVLLAEGTHDGFLSVIGATVSLWTNAGLTTSSGEGFTTTLNQNPFITIPEPATLTLILVTAFACGTLRRHRFG